MCCHCDDLKLKEKRWRKVQFSILLELSPKQILKLFLQETLAQLRVPLPTVRLYSSEQEKTDILCLAMDTASNDIFHANYIF